MKKYFFTACIITLSLVFSPIISVNVMNYVQKKNETDYVEYITENAESLKIKKNDFVCGAVAAAMPSTYEIEAIKAQAVCILTYISYLNGINKPITYEEIEYSYEEPDEKIRKAVDSVKDIMIYYNNKPAMTLAHQLNNGKTDSYNGYEYLAEVESPGDKLCADKPDTQKHYGMSRYGADFMARQGSDYKEIIAHYFPNTELK